jgi:hypothetical protein
MSPAVVPRRRRFAAMALLVLLSGCAQYWTDVTGGQRGRTDFIADSKQCELDVFGTTSWREARANAMAESSGRKSQTEFSLAYEHYAACLEHAGWIMKPLESRSAAPGA